ncbi:MAG TPA: hypothetical protein QF555_05025 [Candidatus Thalassarchaeaceae archaeon]|nr:hypothetical protein [Candidatus Thalassarchaeaceae archaeon]
MGNVAEIDEEEMAFGLSTIMKITGTIPILLGLMIILNPPIH